MQQTVTRQGFLRGTTVHRRQSHQSGRTPDLSLNYSLLPNSDTPNIEGSLKLDTEVDKCRATSTNSTIRTAGNDITRQKPQPHGATQSTVSSCCAALRSGNSPTAPKSMATRQAWNISAYGMTHLVTGSTTFHRRSTGLSATLPTLPSRCWW